MAAAWADALREIDLWIEAIPADELDARLARIESLPSTERFGALRAAVPDLGQWAPAARRRAANAACEAVRTSGAPRRICTQVEAAFDELCGSERGDGVVVEQLVRAVRSAGESLAIPAHEGSLAIQRAVRLLDQRLHGRLERLSTQAAWLGQCDDVWTEPGAMVVIAGLIEDTRRRRWMAMLAAESFWEEADQDLRRAVLECVEAVQGGTDTAATHARMRHISREWGRVPTLSTALQAIDWPADRLARLHWSPPAAVRIEAGRMLERLRARSWFAARQDQRGWRRASEELEEAAVALLAALRSGTGSP